MATTLGAPPWTGFHGKTAPEPAQQIAPEPIGVAVAPEPSEAWSLHGYIEALATRHCYTLRSVVVEELTAHGCKWDQLEYAAGLKSIYRKRGRYDQDAPLLEVRRLVGRGRNVFGVWGPAKWRLKAARYAYRTCEKYVGGCGREDFIIGRVHFRRGLCPACYFRQRKQKQKAQP